MEEILYFIPKKQVTHFDVMDSGKFRCQLTLKLTPGMSYEYGIIRQMAVLQKPSLRGSDFVLIPTNQRV